MMELCQKECMWESTNQKLKTKKTQSVITTHTNIFSTKIKIKFQRGKGTYKYKSGTANLKKHVSSSKCN